MTDQELESTLWKMFDNINTWLKFGEAKNAYLISFISLEVTLLKLKNGLSDLTYVAIFFLIASFVISVFSFYPKNKIVHWAYQISKSLEHQSESDSILFYGHIAKYSVNDFLKKLEANYKTSLKDKKYLSDLCCQIVINAGIADEKFSMFKLGFWLMLVGQCFVVASFWVK